MSILGTIGIAIAYYLRHQQTVETYLQEREQLAGSVRSRLTHMRLGDRERGRLGDWENGEDKLLGMGAFLRLSSSILK